MPQTCSVPYCANKGGHCFPKDNNRLERWLLAIRKPPNYVPKKFERVCKKHFKPEDYTLPKEPNIPNPTAVLKRDAVPSKFSWNCERKQKVNKKIEEQHCTKNISEDVLQINGHIRKHLRRLMKMTEVVEEESKVADRECRTCLKPMPEAMSACNIFQAWTPAWTGMAATIAEDLAKLANLEITEIDKPPDMICEPCYRQLLQAATFAAKVRVCDQILRRRYEKEMEIASKVWPKPIQVDKNVNCDMYHEVEIKQEKLSDDEYDMITPDISYGANESYLPPEQMEIKIEPEEIDETPPLQITINGTMSLNPDSSTVVTPESSTVVTPDVPTVVNGTGEYEAIIAEGLENTELSNGSNHYQDEQHLDAFIKEEPPSEGEDVEHPPDLSLDCLLCAKVFNTVTGLKAHVIAQHSYKSVKRKLDGSESPVKKLREEHKCQICGRSFTTSTDLMVHETCHNKHACYVCSEKFDSFNLLTLHGKKCVAMPAANAIKKLDDVIRPLKEDKLSNSDIDQTSQDSTDSSMKLLLEIHSKNSETKSETSSSKSETETGNDVEMQMKMLNQDCIL